MTSSPPPPPLNPKTTICFSFAAYAKTLISHLHHHSNIPIATGLTQQELTHIESTHRFSFPPDLRSILREGLPVGQGFPNWRASSEQQLDILINLPILGLCKEVHRRKFWHKKWGHRPKDDDHAVDLAKGYLKKYPVPVLVPVYRNCYVPASPCLSGNPVFYIDGLDVKVCSYDVVGFFKDLCGFMGSPVWAATVARRVEFWSDMVELRRSGGELRRCLEDVRLRLRDGGWDEDDVDEMMEMNGGDDDDDVRVLSERLLSGGWSRGDVVESLGCLSDDMDDPTVEIGDDFLFDFEHLTCSTCVDNESQSDILGPVLDIRSINNNSIVV